MALILFYPNPDSNIWCASTFSKQKTFTPIVDYSTLLYFELTKSKYLSKEFYYFLLQLITIGPFETENSFVRTLRVLSSYCSFAALFRTKFHLSIQNCQNLNGHLNGWYFNATFSIDLLLKQLILGIQKMFFRYFNCTQLTDAIVLVIFIIQFS